MAFAALVALLTISEEAHGAQKAIRSNVYGILTGSSYAGCMVQIGTIPDTAGLNCPVQERTWVTLDCDGNWMRLSAASNNLRQAQTALLTGDRITVTIDDTKKAGNFCLGRQVILFR
jgi:hypothetical protein